MPETRSIEDVTRYLLGELTSAERRTFERDLENSPEIRKLLTELEEGTVAMALSAKQRQPPAAVWSGIRSKLEEQNSRSRFALIWQFPLLRNGWAVAAICAAGCLIAVTGLYRTRVTPASSVQQSPRPSEQQNSLASVPENVFESSRAEATVHPSATTELLNKSLQEIGALKWQVAEMNNRMALLSSTITQQEAQLNAPSHIRFFVMTPGRSEPGDAPKISPGLQHALFIAMARELGWANQGEHDDSPSHNPGLVPEPSMPDTNEVIFVDLPPPTPDVTAVQSKESLLASATGSETLPGDASNVPGFLRGKNAVLVFDNSIVPSGTPLTFWSASASGSYFSVGTTSVGDQPVVVTVPGASETILTGNIMVTSQNPNGTTTVFQFPTSTPTTQQTPIPGDPIGNNPQQKQP